MAVYKRSYRGYAGVITPEWSRFLVLTRYAWRGLFSSRIMTGFFVVCFLPFLVTALMIYLNHNATIMQMFKVSASRLFSVDAHFFKGYLSAQVGFAFLLTAFVGPGLIAPDLANNSLVLYFCRPFSKAEYVLGKLAVLATLLSCITWIPGLALFGIEASLSGWKWTWENLYLAGALFAGAWILIAVLSLLALALSAWVKWKPVAGAMLLGVMFFGAGFGAAINKVWRTEIGTLISVPALLETVWDSMFGLSPQVDFSPYLAWIALLANAAVYLWMISRKLRAFEVVR